MERMPLSLYAACLDCMAEDDAKDLREYLENKDYEAVCTGTRNPKFPVTQENSIILKYYKERGWISSYKQISDEEYQAYAKHKSPTTV